MATPIQSNADPAQPAAANIALRADYAFSNPDSDNGSSGTLSLTISSTGNLEMSVGEVIINMPGTVINLSFMYTASLNSSITIDTEGQGTLTVPPHPGNRFSATINIYLQPGFEAGTLRVGGFPTKYTIKATAIHHIS